MKKITEETLNAIQENVRTRETQELDYKRDNLFKGSWKDFEIKDLKHNLIENGWDSFEPYGSGENEVKNWDFSTQDNWLDFMTKFKYEDNKVVIDFNNNHGGIQQNVTGLRDGIYMLRARVRVSGKDPAIMRFQWGGEACDMIEVKNNNEWFTMETEMKGSGTATFYVYKARPSTNRVEIDWVQITPIDNQHLVVEKTPLGNGLTRIQTWGGNNIIKLIGAIGLGHEGEHTLSTYFDALNIDYARVFFQGAGVGKNVEKGLFTITGNLTSGINSQYRVLARSATDNLDFIASNPQIVEGDVPNPTMIVTPLNDGREHVQVYGATKDTKLVYSGDEGFIGENYGLKTTIENNGIDLDLSTSLTEEKKRIEKGENKVNLQGELSTKLSIEIGVPSE